MNKNLNLILKIFAAVAFVLSCLWSYYDFNFEPVIAAVVSLSALIGLFIEQRITQNKSGVTQNQRSGDNSQNYQAGGNINITHKK